jgi:hypothetical protein
MIAQIGEFAIMFKADAYEIDDWVTALLSQNEEVSKKLVNWCYLKEDRVIGLGRFTWVAKVKLLVKRGLYVEDIEKAFRTCPDFVSCKVLSALKEVSMSDNYEEGEFFNA